jgi:hypothetical protein
MNLCYVMWYAHYRPEAITKRKFKLELNNEFTVLILSYVMMTFTSFVLHQSASFLMGYVFVLLVAYVLFVNITFMLIGQYQNAQVEKKKSVNQIAYGNRFGEFKSVERLAYMMRVAKNQKRIGRTFHA